MNDWVLIVDFNSRIGEPHILDGAICELNQGICDVRKSKDVLVNPKGRLTVGFMDDVGMVVLNDRMRGNLYDDWTFSPLDVLWVNPLLILYVCPIVSYLFLLR